MRRGSAGNDVDQFCDELGYLSTASRRLCANRDRERRRFCSFRCRTAWWERGNTQQPISMK